MNNQKQNRQKKHDNMQQGKDCFGKDKKSNAHGKDIKGSNDCKD